MRVLKIITRQVEIGFVAQRLFEGCFRFLIFAKFIISGTDVVPLPGGGGLGSYI